MKLLRHILIALSLVGIGIVSPMPAYGALTESVSAHDVATMKVSGGRLELSVTTDRCVRFDIYSITGQLIRTVNVSDGTAAVELPRGMYIVKTDRWARQIVVK